jgi:hypothetical protein
MDKERVIRIRDLRLKPWCRRPNLHLIAAIGLLACLLLGVACDYGLSWGKIQGLQYGVLQCMEGPESLQWTSWSCLEKVACYDQTELCQLAEDGRRAGLAYTIATLLAAVCQLLAASKLYMAWQRKDYGHPLELYICLGLLCYFKAAGLIIWFKVTGAQLLSCSNDAFCLSAGAYTALGVAAATVLACLYAAWQWYHRDCNYDSGVMLEHDQIFKISLPVWLSCVLCAAAFSLGLMSLALVLADWVEISGMKGSLISIDSWGSLNNFGYDCIEALNCSYDSALGSCLTFQDLSQAAAVFIFFELISLLSLVCWLDYVFHLLCFRQYGFRMAAYYSIIAACCSHIYAVQSWWLLSRASMHGKSALSESYLDRWTLAAGFSPKLELAACATMAFTIALWVFVYFNRPAPKPMSPRPASFDDSPTSPLSPEEDESYADLSMNSEA